MFWSDAPWIWIYDVLKQWHRCGQRVFISSSHETRSIYVLGLDRIKPMMNLLCQGVVGWLIVPAADTTANNSCVAPVSMVIFLTKWRGWSNFSGVRWLIFRELKNSSLVDFKSRTLCPVSGRGCLFSLGWTCCLVFFITFVVNNSNFVYLYLLICSNLGPTVENWI